MVEKLPKILDRPQILEERFRPRENFASIHQDIILLMRQIDGLKKPSLTLSQKETLFIFILWMNKPSFAGIAKLLGRDAKEIEERIDYVYENENQEFEKLIFRLIKRTKLLSWTKGEPKTITREFKDRIIGLRKEGCGPTEMARKLDRHLYQIKYAMKILRRDGEIE